MFWRDIKLDTQRPHFEIVLDLVTTPALKSKCWPPIQQKVYVNTYNGEFQTLYPEKKKTFRYPNSCRILEVSAYWKTKSVLMRHFEWVIYYSFRSSFRRFRVHVTLCQSHWRFNLKLSKVKKDSIARSEKN